MATPAGMPIWYELLTSDVEGAKRFYGDIVGWTANTFPSPAGGTPYTIWQVGEASAGGLAMPPANAAMAPGWLAYFHVADVDAKVAEVERAGGSVAMAATNLPGVGRIALVADPQGVPFYLMKPAPPPGMEDAESTCFSETLPGRCAWHELVTTDQQAALPFYAQLLGWTSNEAMPMGPMGDYTFLDCAGVRLGAMMNQSAPEQPLRWTFYFKVPDADRAAAQVAELGGAVLMGPMAVPGGQRVVLATDPAGTGVGFISGQRQ